MCWLVEGADSEFYWNKESGTGSGTIFKVTPSAQ
jgi:hypothetical protein